MVDAVTLEVFRNRFDAIAEEMQNALLKSAYSIILKEGGDCSCALFSASGEVIAQATANPGHLAALIPAVASILRRFPGPSIDPGDVFILNDPYDGGTHIPDVIVAVPIFHRSTLVALGCALAHQQDMGGKTPGSMVTDATEIYQEGLIIPADRLYIAGKTNESLFGMIRSNVRVPAQVVGDILAEVAAGRTAAKRLGELLAIHGVERFQELTSRLLDYSEDLTRRQLETIPDGVYEFSDYLDSDGIDLDRRLIIKVAITVSGSDVSFDFSGTSPQVRGPANTAPTGALGPVYYVLRAITGSDIPNNSGCFRPVSVFAPLGTILNPRRPAPVSIRYHTLKRVVDVLLGALAPALPDKIPAASHGAVLCMSLGGTDTETGKSYVYMECNVGGTGASARRDGVDNSDSNLGNTRNIPAEAAEMEYPVRIWTNRLRRDSGGAGATRGGLGTVRAIELLRGEVVVSHRNDRHDTPPWGLFGGRPGARWHTVTFRRDGTQESVPSRRTFELRAGDFIVAFLGGGGGYGPPLARDPELVLADVLDGKVSHEAAAELYGTVIRDGVIDEAATQDLRAAPKAKDLLVGRDTSPSFYGPNDVPTDSDVVGALPSILSARRQGVSKL